jgi:hypothetical protein
LETKLKCNVCDDVSYQDELCQECWERSILREIRESSNIRIVSSVQSEIIREAQKESVM